MLHVFWHIAAMQQFDWIYQHQWDLLHSSGLYAAADRITIGVVNFNAETRIRRDVIMDRKVQTHVHPDREQFEFFTLNLLQQWVHGPAKGNHPVWYFHTKGATTITDPVVDAPRKNGVHYWKCYMEYFLIERWRDCEAALATHDACGVEWRTEPSPHFSGNFWAANTDYLRRLPNVIGYQRIAPHDRMRAEMWLGQARPRTICFHNTNQNLYRFSVLPETYRRT